MYYWNQYNAVDEGKYYYWYKYNVKSGATLYNWDTYACTAGSDVSCYQWKVYESESTVVYPSYEKDEVTVSTQYQYDKYALQEKYRWPTYTPKYRWQKWDAVQGYALVSNDLSGTIQFPSGTETLQFAKNISANSDGTVKGWNTKSFTGADYYNRSEWSTNGYRYYMPADESDEAYHITGCSKSGSTYTMTYDMRDNVISHWSRGSTQYEDVTSTSLIYSNGHYVIGEVDYWLEYQGPEAGEPKGTGYTSWLDDANAYTSGKVVSGTYYGDRESQSQPSGSAIESVLYDSDKGESFTESGYYYTRSSTPTVEGNCYIVKAQTCSSLPSSYVTSMAVPVFDYDTGTWSYSGTGTDTIYYVGTGSAGYYKAQTMAGQVRYIYRSSEKITGTTGVGYGEYVGCYEAGSVLYIQESTAFSDYKCSSTLHQSDYVLNTDASAYPENGRNSADGLWYIRLSEKGTMKTYTKTGDVTGTVTNSDSGAYPSNGYRIVSGVAVWYESNETTTERLPDESVIVDTLNSTDSEAYPDNGEPDPKDGYWYKKYSEKNKYSKGTTLYGTLSSENYDAYVHNDAQTISGVVYWLDFTGTIGGLERFLLDSSGSKTMSSIITMLNKNSSIISEGTEAMEESVAETASLIIDDVHSIIFKADEPQGIETGGIWGMITGSVNQ